MKVLVLAVALLLGACGWVTDEQFSRAKALCQSHGGIRAVESTADFRRISARCRNGVHIEDDLRESNRYK